MIMLCLASISQEQSNTTSNDSEWQPVQKIEPGVSNFDSIFLIRKQGDKILPVSYTQTKLIKSVIPAYTKSGKAKSITITFTANLFGTDRKPPISKNGVNWNKQTLELQKITDSYEDFLIIYENKIMVIIPLAGQEVFDDEIKLFLAMIQSMYKITLTRKPLTK